MSKKYLPLPSKEEIEKQLEYCPDTGVFLWKPGRRNAGMQAGCVRPSGYRIISIRTNGKTTGYRAHRLAWVLLTGKDPGDLTVDHENRQKDDNRAENLRLATPGEQSQNREWGLGFSKTPFGKWVARIKIDKEDKYLGTFPCPLLARLAYVDACREYFGEFSPV